MLYNRINRTLSLFIAKDSQHKAFSCLSHPTPWSTGPSHGILIWCMNHNFFSWLSFSLNRWSTVLSHSHLTASYRYKSISVYILYSIRSSRWETSGSTAGMSVWRVTSLPELRPWSCWSAWERPRLWPQPESSKRRRQLKSSYMTEISRGRSGESKEKIWLILVTLSCVLTGSVNPDYGKLCPDRQCESWLRWACSGRLC